MDDGFLRVSAGGGTNANTKSFIDLSGSTNNARPTGRKIYYNLTTAAALSKTVISGQVYMVSYWRNNSSPFTINGGTSVYQAGKTINSWTYHVNTYPTKIEN